MTGPANMQPKNASPVARSPPRLSLARGNLPLSQMHIGPSTTTVNPTTSIPNRSVLARLTPSPIQTRIPERYAVNKPEAVNAAETEKLPNQSSTETANAGGTSPRPTAALKTVTLTIIKTKAAQPSFQAPQA